MRALLALGLAALLATAALAGSTDRLGALRGQALDWFFPSGAADADILVVGIDRASIAELDAPWPWSRDIHAQILDNLTAAGADVVAFDVVFDLPGEGDAALAEAIRRHGRTVLVADTALVDLASDVPQVTELRLPLPHLAEAAAGVAHPFVETDDADGVVRTVPLIVESPDRRLVPSLALAAVTLADDADPGVAVIRPEGVQAGDRLHPTEPGRLLRVNWSPELRSPASAADQYLSAVEVFHGRFPPAQVSGRIVLIGATDPLLGDNVLTPTLKSGAGTPGVFVHANAASTMRTAQYRAFPRAVETAGAAFVLALAVGLLALFAPLWTVPLAGIVLAVAYFLAASLRFDSGQAMDVVLPYAALVLAGVAASGFRYFAESRERRTVSTLFSQYVPKQVAHQLLAEGRAEVAAEGERLEVTVFFCDLRGFTALAAVREPAEVRDMLSIYYDHGTRIVLEHGGTLMQYVGDEIFAVFGAPIPGPDDAQRALDCAVALQGAADAMARELEAKGLPPLTYGIGLNTGPVVAAHIGGALRKQYGVIGDTVNVGSRICALAQAGEVVMPDVTRQRLSAEPDLEPLGPVALKGVSEDPRVTRVRLPGSVPLGDREAEGKEKARIVGRSTS